MKNYITQKGQSTSHIYNLLQQYKSFNLRGLETKHRIRDGSEKSVGYMLDFCEKGTGT